MRRKGSNTSSGKIGGHQGTGVLAAASATASTPPQEANLVVWLILGGAAVVVCWLAFEIIKADMLSARATATFAGVILLAFKVGFPLRFGPPEHTPTEKCKSLGADLAFASLSFDITMYLGNVQLNDLGPIKGANSERLYIIAGIFTFLVWLLGLYPTTAGKAKASAVAIYTSMVFGVFFYFGRILLYVFRG